MIVKKYTYVEEPFYLNLFYSMIFLGIVGLAATFYREPAVAWVNILTANFLFLCLGLFGVFMLALTNIIGASFVSPYRRILEGLAGTVPYLCVSMLAILLGSHTLYEWTHTDIMLSDKILIQKMNYLNFPFFTVRMALCMLIWSLLANYFRRKSRQQDQDSEQAIEIQQTVQARSAVGMVLFVLSFSVASFDWIMSLEPHWFSTIFAVFTFSGLMTSGIAFTILAIVFFQSRGFLQEVNSNHFHDLGKLLMGFSTFWAYIWYCQYLLIWYANIPEEVEYYVLREHFGWDWVFWLNFIINWLFPFLLLLPRESKRNPELLKRICWMIMVGQWLNVYIMVAPKVFEHNGITHPMIGLSEVMIAAGYCGFFLLVFFRKMAQAPIVPQNDPFLEEGMALEQ